MSEVPLEIRVRWEIWESFVSLLRSYAGAAGPDHTVHSFSDWVKVERPGRAVRFCFAPHTGEVVWREAFPDGEMMGTFHINQDGTFQAGSESKPIDMAAIDWIAGLKKEQAFDFSLLETNLKSSHEPRDRDNL